MSTEDLLKQAALAGREFLATEQVSALEHDLYDSTHALAVALRESMLENAKLKRCVRFAIEHHGLPTDITIAILAGVPL